MTNCTLYSVIETNCVAYVCFVLCEVVTLKGRFRLGEELKVSLGLTLSRQPWRLFGVIQHISLRPPMPGN